MNKFQQFKLNFSRDMSKMRYFNNAFSKIAKWWRLFALSSPLIFDLGDLKLRDLPKLWLFKRIITKWNLKLLN